MTGPSGTERMLGGLLRDSHLMAFEDLPGKVAEHARAVGVRQVRIYLADLQESVLRLLTGHGEDAGEAGPGGPAKELGIEGSLAGRAFQHGRTVTAPGGAEGSCQWWVPVVDGAERLGVLQATGPDDESTRGNLHHLASLVALIVVSKAGLSDSYARLTRTRSMNVAAEMQWNLMPPLTFAGERVVVSAAMEPAYEIGGDAFDYALSGDTVHLAVFDAMGHDATAGLTANLAMAACRNNRRQGKDLVETGEAIERVLTGQFGTSGYATAVLAHLDTRTGLFSWVNRGHHPPVVIRGGRWAGTLSCPPAHPLGTNLGLKSVLCREQLEPGDRVLLYTDGFTEARSPDGQEFGLDRLVDFLVRHDAAGLPVPETLRRLTRSVMEYHQGHLNDDGTVLLLEWHGPGPAAAGRSEALAGLPGR
ncbi:PP2C family protein-serine/threonine phosphatase [Streptomyces sp. SCUT-3]|uniref:PP2C family protein-serine/threonine phosphatase n=2 Tax=Streptomyces TaxID=1883 RepID=UPI002677FD5A